MRHSMKSWLMATVVAVTALVLHSALFTSWNGEVIEAAAAPPRRTARSFEPNPGQFDASIESAAVGFQLGRSNRDNTQVIDRVPTNAGNDALVMRIRPLVPPAIKDFSPASGGPGTVVRITGQGFTSTTDVMFNGTAAKFTIDSDSQLSATVPTGATSGPIAVTGREGSTKSATNFTVSAAGPSIRGFTPTSGTPGTAVTISGSGFTGATTVGFNGTPSAKVSVDSDTQITAAVPTGATTGPISVTTSGGTDRSTANFTVTAATPTISSFSPTSGPVDTAVVITGSNFTGASSVQFNGVGARFTVNSATQITANVPPTATTGAITVTTSAGMARSATNFTVTASRPNISSFSPTSGPVGTAVKIAGSAFTGATDVRFASSDSRTGVSARFSVESDTAITATVPTGAVSGPISVAAPGGSATSTASFTVTVPAPLIRAFTPASGPVGTEVTISGDNFTGATAVQFNGTNAAKFAVSSDTTVVAVVATGTTTGPITISTPGGTARSLSNFTVTVPGPMIAGFAPASGPVGTNVVINGSGFRAVTDVRFNGDLRGGVPAKFSIDSDTSITASVPTGATTGPITLFTQSASVVSATNFTVTASGPSIRGFTPASGPVDTEVTISGDNFTGATAVQFNGTNAARFAVSSDSSIVAVVPAGATTGPIGVTTPAGSTRSLTNFTVAASAPVIRGFTPTSGTVGTAVTISGTNFTGATDVSFNGTSSRFVINSDTQITTTVPTGATTGPISITATGGTVRSTTNFTVNGENRTPTISSFSPTSGAVGSAVKITGTNFTGATEVAFNGVPARFMVDSEASITTTVPTGATTGPISVSTPNGSVRSSMLFTVTVADRGPVIRGFTPASGPVDTEVTISGDNFTGATAVQFNGTNAARFAVSSDSSIVAVVPAGATTGPIGVTTPAGSTRSLTNFTVAASAPVIRGFTPMSGPVDTSVTIMGANFTGATAVQFNGVNARFTVNSDNQITASVPAGAATGPIGVTTPAGSVSSAASFTVTAPNPGAMVAMIVGFNPTGATAGTMITISGKNFTGATEVAFNGVPSVFTVASDTTIMATVPPTAASGPISVTTAAGTGRTASIFTVIANPTRIVGFSPSTGAVGTAVTITGTRFTGATAVRFNGVNANFTVVSDSVINTVVPAGALSGLITVTVPAGSVDSPRAFTVAAATAPSLLVDGIVDFGNVNIGDTITRPVNLRNLGGSPLTIMAPMLTRGQEAGFSFTMPPTLTLAPGQSTSFTVTFKPTAVAVALVTGSIEINSNGGAGNVLLRARSIETIAPQVRLGAPLGSEMIIAGRPFTIRFTGSDNDQLSGFIASYSTDGGASFPFEIARVGPTATEVIWNVPDGLQTTNARVQVVARDRSGNFGMDTSGLFTIQRPPDPQPASMLQVNITFDPPPPGIVAAPLNVRVNVMEAGKGPIVRPAADDDEPPELLGYNIYRVPAPAPGQPLPTPEQIVDPANLVGSIGADMTSFDEMVSTSQASNFVYSITSFFGGGQQSGGSMASNTDIPVIKNPSFKKGSIFIDAAGSFIKDGAIMIVNDSETYPLMFDASGAFLTVDKKTPSMPGGLTLKKLVKKGRPVVLLVKNPDGKASVSVIFTRQ